MHTTSAQSFRFLSRIAIVPKNVFEKPPWPPNSGGKVFKVPQVCRSFSEEI